MANKASWTANIGRATIAAAALVLLAGPLIKFGILPWSAGLGMFAIGALLAGIGGIFCLIALLRKRGGMTSVVAAAVGLSAIAIPAVIVFAARNYPPINDFTTDPANPPQFVGITPAARGPDAGPIGYDPAFAPQQEKAFPDLKPLILADKPAGAFDKALATAEAQGWKIVASSSADGRIEATATVPWWGFKDDIVIRLTPEATGTKIDVRSKSRVGQGDLGVNAKRIGDYLAKLKTA